MLDVTVVVPTWNGRPELAACLDGLRASFPGAARTIVVDNGSTDGTGDWLGASHPGVSVIRNPANRGFAAAVNQGIRASATAWVALLNNDAVSEPEWLGRLLAAGSADPRIGAVASRMMFRDAPGVVSSAGIRLDPSGGAWDLLVGSRTWPDRPTEVFGASGGACLLRREMLEDVGLFEEGFFAYLEDVDLAWRARARGWKAVLAPDAVVYHAVSGTAGEGSAFKRFHLARNRWRVLLRNHPTRPFLANLPIILAYDLLSVANSLVHGDLVPLRGRLAALREARALLAQRRAVQARTTVPWEQVRAAMSPLESPLTLYRRARLVGRLASAPRA